MSLYIFSPLLCNKLYFLEQFQSHHKIEWKLQTPCMALCFQKCIRSDQISRSVVSDSLRPHESQHARPPWAFATAILDSFSYSNYWTKGTELGRTWPSEILFHQVGIRPYPRCSSHGHRAVDKPWSTLGFSPSPSPASPPTKMADASNPDQRYNLFSSQVQVSHQRHWGVRRVQGYSHIKRRPQDRNR